MNEYLHWNEQIITDFSSDTIDAMYNQGYVFGRPENGFMQQTRSIRIDLSDWETTSENRRILRKTEGLTMKSYSQPCTSYSWEIGKMGKDFYETKFGDGTFSANKIKELMTSPERKDFNRILTYTFDDEKVGYCIGVETDDIFHYSYPFYNLNSEINNLGMGMMIRAVQYAKESGKQYIYLGSFQRSSDVYKLQFKNMEWFDGEGWQDNLDALKASLD